MNRYNSKITAEEALSMLEDGTQRSWRIIPESQTRYYPHAGQKNAFFVLCLDQTCKGKVYVVPKGLQPHYSDYDRLLKFLRKKGLPILPKVNVNMTNFPGLSYMIDAGRFLISGLIKPTGSLSLKSLHSKSPFTYTPGKLANIKFTASSQLNSYLEAWNKISLIKDSDNHWLRLKVSNSITNEYYDFDVSLEGNVFSATITLSPRKQIIGHEWVLEGMLSLKITGEFIEKNLFSVAKGGLKVGHVKSSNLSYNIYHLIGFGVGGIALGAMTIFTGGLDVPAVALGGAVLTSVT